MILQLRGLFQFSGLFSAQVLNKAENNKLSNVISVFYSSALSNGASLLGDRISAVVKYRLRILTNQCSRWKQSRHMCIWDKLSNYKKKKKLSKLLDVRDWHGPALEDCQGSCKNRQMPQYLVSRIFKQRSLPILTYVCQTWTFEEANIEKLAKTQRAMERAMSGIK